MADQALISGSERDSSGSQGMAEVVQLWQIDVGVVFVGRYSGECIVVCIQTCLCIYRGYLINIVIYYRPF